MLFPKKTGVLAKDLPKLVELLNETAKEKWPNAESRPKKVINPIKDGDTSEMDDGTLRCEKYPEMKGHWVIMASSKQKPGVVDAELNPIMDKNEFYSGCFARASLTCFAYAPGKGREQSKTGLSFGLQNLMKARDGERFSGKANAEDDFASYKSTGSDSAPAASESNDSESMFG